MNNNKKYLNTYFSGIEDLHDIIKRDSDNDTIISYGTVFEVKQINKITHEEVIKKYVIKRQEDNNDYDLDATIVIYEENVFFASSFLGLKNGESFDTQYQNNDYKFEITRVYDNEYKNSGNSMRK